MSKYQEYQEALTILKTYIVDYDDEFFEDKYLYDDFKEEFDILQELVDQTKTPTLEEVKKEWKKLDYEYCEERERITLRTKNQQVEIIIGKRSKIFFKRECGSYEYEIFTFQEHQLLTKTFKALGWFDE